MTIARTLGAGLAAGLTNLVLGFTFAHFVGVEKFQELLRQHNLRPIGEPADAIPHILVRVLMGFVWAFGYAFKAWGDVHIGLLPRSWGMTIAAWGLVEMQVTAFVGGWLATGRRFWGG